MSTKKNNKMNLNTNSLFKRPFIVYRTNSEPALEGAKNIIRYLITRHNISIIYIEDVKAINSQTVFPDDLNLQKKHKNIFHEFNLENEQSDICIILGGDGTCLWANLCYEKKQRPSFITFHLGFLGYLAIYDISNYKDIIDELYNPDRQISFESRNLVHCKIFKKKKDNQKETLVNELFALNEILLERGSSMKMLGMDLFLDSTNEPLTKIYADGLIFSSSTGSTAYNLSAGGPLLHYDVEGLVVNAICPFSLSFRPLVIPKGVKMIIQGIEDYPLPSIVRDGNSRTMLNQDEYAEIFLSEMKIDFIILNKFVKSRIDLWKEKIIDSLGWNNLFKH